MPYTSTHFYLANTEKSKAATHPDDMLRNNVDGKPSFFVMVSYDTNIRQIMAALMGKKAAAETHLFQTSPTPSSNLVLEVTKDAATGTLYVEAHYNDQQI